jgi:hypothetical protein
VTIALSIVKKMDQNGSPIRDFDFWEIFAPLQLTIKVGYSSQSLPSPDLSSTPKPRVSRGSSRGTRDNLEKNFFIFNGYGLFKVLFSSPAHNSSQP